MIKTLLEGGPAEGEELVAETARLFNGRWCVCSYYSQGYYALVHGPIESGRVRNAEWIPDADARFAEKITRDMPRSTKAAWLRVLSEA